MEDEHRENIRRVVDAMDAITTGGAIEMIPGTFDFAVEEGNDADTTDLMNSASRAFNKTGSVLSMLLEGWDHITKGCLENNKTTIKKSCSLTLQH